MVLQYSDEMINMCQGIETEFNCMCELSPTASMIGKLVYCLAIWGIADGALVESCALMMIGMGLGELL